VDPAPRDTAAAAALLELCKSGKKEIEEIGRLVREETKKQNGKIVFGSFCNGLVVFDRARATTPCTVVVMTLCPIVSRSLSHVISLLLQITKPHNPRYLLHDRRSSLSLSLSSSQPKLHDPALDLVRRRLQQHLTSVTSQILFSIRFPHLSRIAQADEG
jgi:hypothetical protein